jgi:hypothetical protein
MTVYDRTPANSAPPRYDNRQPNPAPPPARQPYPPASSQPPQRRQAPSDEEDLIWNPGANLYSRNAIAPRPQPAASGVKPADNNQPPRQNPAPARCDNNLGVTGGTSQADNEVFSPDMYLSGGR